jgi:hypothetical protein
MAKVQGPNLNNGLDTNKKFAGSPLPPPLWVCVVASCCIAGKGRRVNSDPDKINGLRN